MTFRTIVLGLIMVSSTAHAASDFPDLRGNIGKRFEDVPVSVKYRTAQNPSVQACVATQLNQLLIAAKRSRDSAILNRYSAEVSVEVTDVREIREKRASVDGYNRTNGPVARFALVARFSESGCEPVGSDEIAKAIEEWAQNPHLAGGEPMPAVTFMEWINSVFERIRKDDTSTAARESDQNRKPAMSLPPSVDQK